MIIYALYQEANQDRGVEILTEKEFAGRVATIMADYYSLEEDEQMKYDEEATEALSDEELESRFEAWVADIASPDDTWILEKRTI